MKIELFQLIYPNPRGPFQIVKLTLTIGFVRYPRSTGCSASVSLLYAVRNPGREHFAFLFYPRHPLLYNRLLYKSSRMKPLHMQCNSLVVRTRARESFPSSVSCFRSRRSSHEPEPDGLRQAVLWISKNSCYWESGRKEESSPIEMSVTRRGLGFHSFDETKWSLTFIPPRSIALKSSDSFFLYATQKGESPTRLLAQHTLTLTRAHHKNPGGHI